MKYRLNMVYASCLVLMALTACGGGGGGNGSGVDVGMGAGTGVDAGTEAETEVERETETGTEAETGTVDGNATDVSRKPQQLHLYERIEPYDTKGQPAVFSLKTLAVQRPMARTTYLRQIKLAAPEAALLTSQEKSSRSGASAATPVQIGFRRAVQPTTSVADTQALLVWHQADNGEQVAAISFESAQSKGVRLGVQVQGLPKGSLLRFYGEPTGDIVEVTAQQLTEQSRHLLAGGASAEIANTYWSPSFDAPMTHMEVQVPARANVSEVRVSVPALSHLVGSTKDAEGAYWPHNSSSCQVDLMCKPEYLDQSRSVALMMFVRENGQTYTCSGTLMNDAKSSETPYFLTARHCISTPAEAATVNTHWFLRSDACNSASANRERKTLYNGAVLHYATKNTDTAFLELNEKAPPGVLYAGSYFGSPVELGSAVVGIHHPRGDMQKVSEGVMDQHVLGINLKWDAETIAKSSSHYHVIWTSGIVEMGSSGSALLKTIDGSRYVVGQAHMGGSSCADPEGGDYYGRFDHPYKSHLKQWLNP